MTIQQAKERVKKITGKSFVKGVSVNLVRKEARVVVDTEDGYKEVILSLY